MQESSNCIVCGCALTGKQTMFCSVKCKNAVHQSYHAQKKRGLQRKLHFVDQLGGKCMKCGYKNNLGALAFHHVNGKDFALDVRALSNQKIKPILEEMDKCAYCFAIIVMQRPTIHT